MVFENEEVFLSPMWRQFSFEMRGDFTEQFKFTVAPCVLKVSFIIIAAWLILLYLWDEDICLN